MLKPNQPARAPRSRATARAADDAPSTAPATPAPAPSSDGRISRAQRLREERRSQILATALALFGERGYHATSIADIINTAGIARGTFYLYFESKRAIFAELLDRFFATVAGAVRRIDVSPGAATPLEQMDDNLRRVFEVLARERPMARILIREAVGLDEEFDRKLVDFYGRVTALIERALRLGQSLGLVRDCDPALVSSCVLGSIKEVIERAFVVGPLPADRARPALDLEAARRGLVEFNLRAVFREPPELPPRR